MYATSWLTCVSEMTGPQTGMNGAFGSLTTPAPVITGQGPAVEGALLYQRYGCVNCHGPNGLGGVPNPGSEDQAVPPLSGADFRSEFDTPAKIKEIIMGGSVIGKAPIASMPHWGGVLTDEQANDLVAYIQSFK